jgi:uncharacterized membrane protein
MRPNIARHPKEWLLYFPIGLLVAALICLLVFISWPPYIVYQLGKWAMNMWRDDG